MEAAAAFSLAANILQIVELSQKLLSANSQIYQVGTSLQNSELEIVVKDFSLLNRRLQSWARPTQGAVDRLTKTARHVELMHVHVRSNHALQSLETFALESEHIAQELIAALTSLHLSGEASRYRSFAHAILTIWKSKKITETKQRLDEI